MQARCAEIEVRPSIAVPDDQEIANHAARGDALVEMRVIARKSDAMVRKLRPFAQPITREVRSDCTDRRCDCSQGREQGNACDEGSCGNSAHGGRGAKVRRTQRAANSLSRQGLQ